MTEESFVLYLRIIVVIIFMISLIIPSKNNKILNIISFVLILSGAYAIGYRDTSIGTDTEVYVQMFNTSNNRSFEDLFYSILHIAAEPIFFLIVKIGGWFGSNQLSFFLISFLTFLFSYIFCIRLSKIIGNVSPLSLICCYIISFYIINQQINIIRAGLAFSIILNYYLYVFEKKKFEAVLWGILALGVHFTSILAIVIGLIPQFFDFRRKIYYAIFFITLVLAAVNIGVLDLPLIRNLDLGRKSTYLTSEHSTYITGFRFGFSLFNTFFFLVFVKCIKKSDLIGDYLFKIFIISSCLLFMCYQIPFSDRIGAFSWNLIPFLTTIGFISSSHKKTKSAVAYSFLLLSFVTLAVDLIS